MGGTRSNRTNLTANLLPNLRHVIAHAGNRHMGVYGQFGLKVVRSATSKQEGLNTH